MSSTTKSISSTAAEICWVWNTALKSKSFNCEDDSAELFQVMFPDSAIGGKFTGSRTKQTYLLNFAIAPFVKINMAKSVCQNAQGSCNSLVFSDFCLSSTVETFISLLYTLSWKQRCGETNQCQA